jgi:lipoprotein-anchoring transpeptidase ErfK/SrfK
MTNRLTTVQSTGAIRRWAAPAIVTFAATAVLAALTAAPPADAAANRAAHPAQPSEETAPREAGEPIMAIVSIKSQHVTIYDAEGWILRAPVSTGTTGRETPAGVFSIVEKDKDHHSNLYDDASMPNMERITWSGIALHGGPLPGHPASHGCVRMPYGFAEGLFDKTRLGMRVIISPDDAEPVDFTDSALFVPKADAIAAAPERAETLAAEAAQAAKTADEAKKAAVAATRATAPLAAGLKKLEWVKSRADAELAVAERLLAAAVANQTKAEDRQQKAAAKATELQTQLDAATAEVQSKLDATAADAQDPAAAAREAAALKASLHKLEFLKARADADLAAAERVLAAAKASQAKAEDLKQKAAAKAADLRRQFDTAKADANSKLDAAAAAQTAAKLAEAKRIDTAKAAHDAKLALEPVSIFISRKTQRIYVRRGIEPGYDVPVTIRNPDKPLGTHVITAVARTDGGLRWTAVTIDNGDNAKDALDRISIPQDVLDRIAPTAAPRSSIVISDEPLNRETNYRTEFVVVLNNQPQGGLAMRPPSGDLHREDGGFFSGFLHWGNSDSQYASTRQRGGQSYYQRSW